MHEFVQHFGLANATHNYCRFVQAHPNVIKFREAFMTDRYLGIAMDYAEGGDLHDYVCAKYGLLLPL
jgi:hypothetical protein